MQENADEPTTSNGKNGSVHNERNFCATTKKTTDHSLKKKSHNI